MLQTANSAHEDAIAQAARTRLPALDWMRGAVMILMSIDHASGAFNAGRVFADSASMYHPGMALPAAQFLTRWLTHLCAPSFVFLAGAAVALSVERRLAAGEPARTVDRYLLQRGLLIAALDPLWMSWGFTQGKFVVLQVLYAIGTSLMLMAALRRLSLGWLVGLALGLMCGGEALTRLALWTLGVSKPPLALALCLSGGRFPGLVVAYPTLPWLAIMLLGWAFGRHLAFGRPSAPHRQLAWSGLASLAVFAVVRAGNGYGNVLLPRDDGSLVQWLHVSKYPPGLSYYSLELGIMALALSGFFLLARGQAAFPGSRVLTVLGQTAFFYYLLHVHLLEGTAHVLGVNGKLGLASAYLGAATILVVLYPACVRYRTYKRAHPDGWTRYL
jgi:uncharacterized membrane protein